jgi:predicted RNase H-like nuclease/5'-deoxynucleotidase YfbR-like HD superfamily hydrolase
MEYITTYTGEDFAPLAPNTNQIKIEDIAHALSLTCRANGHFVYFYSVAQHCINCANEAKARGLSTKIQLACLLHDGSEAYISDITRPVKKHLPDYLQIENNLQNLIYSHFLGSELSDEENALVKRIDDDILIWEFEKLMEKQVFNNLPKISSIPDFAFRDYAAVENRYIRLANSLTHGDNLVIAFGIDICRAGWCVVKADNLGNSTVCLINHIEILLEMCADIAVIDIPIGLTDSGEDRAFDREARKILEKRRNSVFAVPCRSAVYEETYERACEINKRLTNKGISSHSWGIVPKIREIDEFLCNNPDKKDFLVENHPEVCFTLLRGTPCQYSKKNQQGENERIGVLRKYLDINDLITNHQHSINELARDDIIDAAVLAVTGLRTFKKNPL